MKHGIIFDLDGTLWDSSLEVVDSWNEVLKTYKNGKYVITLEMMQSAMGLPMLDIGKKLWPSLDEKEMLSLLDRCMDYENEYLLTHPGKLYPKVRETLLKLKEKYPLFIVSNAQKGYIEAFLEGTKMSDCFIDHLCWGDTLATKDITISKIVEKYNLGDSIYVGDTLGDEKATRKAGLHFVHASYGFGKAENPDAFLKDFPSLIEVAESILH